MHIDQIHHVTVLVAETEKSMEFYEKVLGLMNDPESAGTSPDFAHLTVGANQQIHLRIGDVPEFVGQHYCLHVDDLNRAISECEAAGVPVRLPRNGRGEFAHILDPSGNDIELRQSK